MLFLACSLQLHEHLLIYFCITETCCLVLYLMLASNLEIRMRLGHFGLATVDIKALRSENGTQTKDNSMGRSHHVSLFVQMRVID